MKASSASFFVVVVVTLFVACSSRRSPYSVDDDDDDDGRVLNLRPTDEDFEDFERELYRDKQRSRFETLIERESYRYFRNIVTEA